MCSACQQWQWINLFDEPPTVRIAQPESAELPNLTEAKKLYTAFPDNVDIATTYARALRLHGQPETALDVLSGFYKAERTEGVMFEFLKAKLMIANGEESETLIRKALNSDGISYTARGKLQHLLAISLDLQGRYEEAGQHYVTALDILGDDPGVRNNYALSLLQKGEYQDAASILERTLEQDPQLHANKHLMSVIQSLP